MAVRFKRGGFFGTAVEFFKSGVVGPFTAAEVDTDGFFRAVDKG